MALVAVCQSAVVAQTPLQIAVPSRTDAISFQHDVLPIFRKKCLACHNAGDASGQLVLESVASILKGGDSGPAATAGKADASLLLKVAAHREEPIMPPPDNDVEAEPLTPTELGLLKLWIDQGAVADAEGTVLSPRQWRSLPAGRNPIYAVALSPDGQFAATGRANQIFIYHVPTGRLVTRLNDPELQARSADKRPGIAHLDVVQSLAFNPEGDVLASGGFRTAKLWRRPRDVRSLNLAAGGAVSAVAVSPQGDWMATADADHQIKLWTVPGGELHQTLAGHEEAIGALQFSANGLTLYSAAEDKTIRVWQIPSGALVGQIDTPTANQALLAVAASPAPETPEDEGEEGTAAGEAEADAQPSEEPAIDLPRYLVTGGVDNLIRVWNIPSSLPEVLPETPPQATALAVSADRQWLAIATATGDVRVQSLVDHELIAVWKAHESAVHDIAFRPAPVEPVTDPESDESEVESETVRPQLLTAGEDGTVRIWSADTGEPVVTLRGSPTAVRTAAFSPDGKQVLAGSEGGSATIWNLDAVEPRWLADGTSGGAASVVAVSADRKRLACSGVIDDRPVILVRDLTTGEISHRLLGHEAEITSLAFSGDATRLASGSADSTARVWDLSDAKFPELARLAGHEAAVTGVAFNSDALQLVSGGADHSVRLWNIADEAELRSFAGHTGPVVAVAMGAGNQPISASADKSLRVWNPADGNVLRTVALADAATALTATSDGARVAVGLADHGIQLVQVSDGAVLHKLEGHPDPVHSLSFSSDATRLVSGSPLGGAVVWNAADGRLLEILPNEAGATSVAYGESIEQIIAAAADGGLVALSLRFAVALPGMVQSVSRVGFRSDGQLALAASLDGILRGFNVTTGQQAFAANHGAPIHSFAISQDAQRLATGGEDKLIKIWNPANGAALPPTQLTGLTAAVQSVAFSADGRRVVGADAESAEILIFDAASGALEQRLVGHEGAVTALVSSQNDAMISAAADDTLRRWQLVAGRQIAGHSQPVNALAVIPPPADQPTALPQVLSGSGDGTLRQWNIETGQAIRQLNHGGPITSVAVRPDGQRFASASGNNTAKLWNAANNQQLAEMRGDLRALAVIARLNQDKTAAAAKFQATTNALAEAEKNVPLVAEASKKAADALTAVNKDVQDKQAALKTAADAKAAAEKLAIEVAAVAQQALLAKNAADEQVALATLAMKTATELLAMSQSTAQTDPNNAGFAQAVTRAQTAVTAADTKLKAVTADQAVKVKDATDKAAVATDMATKALAMTKPVVDATTALQQAESAQNVASQASVIALRDQQEADQLVPALRAELVAAEQRQKQIDMELAAAQQAAQQAEQPLRTVAFSPDGQHLATGGDLGIVHTWDADTGKAVASHVGHTAAVSSLAYVTNDLLLTGSVDESAAVWELNPGWMLERTIGAVDDPSLLINRVTTVAFSPDGQLLATGGGEPSRNGELKVWKVADGTLVQAWPDAHTDAIFGACFSPDATLVASGGADKYLRVFNVASGEQLQTFEGHTDHVLGVQWRADGRVLASCGADNTLRIWNAENGDRIRVIEGFGRQVSSVRFIGQSVNTISSSADKTVRMHNSDNGQNFRNFAGSSDFVYSADATQDGQIVVAGGFDSVLRVWNGANGQLLFQLQPPQEAGTSSSEELDSQQAAK